MARLHAIALLAVLTLAPPAIAQDGPVQDSPITLPHPTALTNDSILKMVKADLGDAIILQTINAQPGHYSTGADDLVALKNAGVSDRVIAAMLAKASAPPAPIVPVNTLPPGVDDLGVYWQNKEGLWIRITPEIVNYKSSNLLVPLATRGVVHSDMNGHIDGPTSDLKLTGPVHILLNMPEGNEPEEYLLLQLKTSSKAREFRSSTGGVFHSSTGATRDDVSFTPTRIAAHVYEFTLANAKPGEYGILPPGSVRSANAASGGKIYTFHLIE